MKDWLIRFSATLLALIIALYAYDQYQAQQIRGSTQQILASAEEKTRALAEQSQAEIDNRALQAQKLATDLAKQRAQAERIALDAQQAALETEQARERLLERNQAFSDQQMRRAAFANDIALLAPLKMQLVECYFNTGAWPVDANACGIKLSDYQGKHLYAVRLNKNYSYVASFKNVLNQESGEVWFRAKPTSVNVQWECFSPDLREVASVITDCRYNDG